MALPIAEEIVGHMKENVALSKMDYVGSLSRSKEAIGDIDLLVVSDNSNKVMDVFAEMKGVKKGHLQRKNAQFGYA